MEAAVVPLEDAAIGDVLLPQSTDAATAAAAAAAEDDVGTLLLLLWFSAVADATAEADDLEDGKDEVGVPLAAAAAAAATGAVAEVASSVELVKLRPTDDD